MLLILRFFYIKIETLQYFHMKMASSRLWAYNPRTGLPVFLWPLMSFHQYWQSQTNQCSSKLIKYQIINQQHTHICVMSLYICMCIYLYTHTHTNILRILRISWLLKVGTMARMPQILNYSNIKWDYVSKRPNVSMWPPLTEYPVQLCCTETKFPT